jgi:hypothetical protein
MRHLVVRPTSETSRRAESRARHGDRCVSQMCSVPRLRSASIIDIYLADEEARAGDRDGAIGLSRAASIGICLRRRHGSWPGHRRSGRRPYCVAGQTQTCRTRKRPSTGSRPCRLNRDSYCTTSGCCGCALLRRARGDERARHLATAGGRSPRPAGGIGRGGTGVNANSRHSDRHAPVGPRGGGDGEADTVDPARDGPPRPGHQWWPSSCRSQRARRANVSDKDGRMYGRPPAGWTLAGGVDDHDVDLGSAGDVGGYRAQ